MEGVTMLSGSSSPTSTTSLTSATVTRAAVAMTTLKRSEEHTSELQSRSDLVCRLLLEKKKKKENSSSTRPNSSHHHHTDAVHYLKPKHLRSPIPAHYIAAVQQQNDTSHFYTHALVSLLSLQ